MKILAFDTCFGAVSVAIGWQSPTGEMVLREAYEERAMGHAERLMPMLAELMEAGGAPSFSELDRVAVTTGPGTFTGVRTGIAAARAIALTTGLPVCGASSLAVMARLASGQLDSKLSVRPLAIAVDARRGEIYLQCFAAGSGHVHALMEPEILTVAEAARRLGSGDWIAAGSGAVPLAEAARDRAGLAVVPVLDRLEPRASVLAGLANGLSVLDNVKPLYLRAPDAKPQSSKTLPRA